MDIQNSARFLDIQIHYSIFGYPIFSLKYGYPKIELWISKNRLIDIKKSILDIQKILLNFGYP